MQGANQLSSLSTYNFSTPNNGTNLTSKIYVFTPADYSTKLILLIIMVTIGIVGFVGNGLVLLFLKAKNKKTYILKALSFERHFNFYVKSLAISDVMSDIVSLPVLCLEMFFDVFQDGWACKISRYLNLTFPCITINNLLVISIEKYFSTRRVPRTFRHSFVRKLVVFAWLAGIIVVLFPAATFRGIRYDLNATHYTVVCKYDKHYLPFRIIFLSFLAFQYMIPSLIIICISIFLTITVRTNSRRTLDIQSNNGIKCMLRANQKRATIIIITLMLAFIVPYVFYFAQVFYNMATKKYIDFQTDYVIRYGSGVIVFSNSAVNVIIHFVQLKGFRLFLKKTFIGRFHATNPNSTGKNDAKIEMQ